VLGKGNQVWSPSDWNPEAVIINKSMMDIPPPFASRTRWDPGRLARIRWDRGRLARTPVSLYPVIQPPSRRATQPSTGVLPTDSAGFVLRARVTDNSSK
jgi:hypothetical protein